ncbi:MAG: lipase family protein [Proteobacteria bacterium]|nr:lipase family protein [Pseudomonadota bacterium]
MTEVYFSQPGLLTPPTARAAYSDRTAWIMAKMSELAYRPFDDSDPTKAQAARQALENDLESGGFELVQTFSIRKGEADTQAILIKKPGVMAILAFRGTTKDFNDIITDLKARWIKTGNGKAHEGFVEAFKSVEDEVKTAIAALPATEPLYVTGHSLGAALATVAAMRCDAVHTLAACYTFGSPRVGGPEWADGLKCPVYRVVNEADGVPLVPPSIVLAFLIPPLLWLSRIGFVGFQHAGDMRYLTVNSKLKVGAAAFVRRAYRVTLTVALGLLKFDLRKLAFFVKDHAIGGYAKKLEDIAIDRNR